MAKDSINNVNFMKKASPKQSISSGISAAILSPLEMNRDIARGLIEWARNNRMVLARVSVGGGNGSMVEVEIASDLSVPVAPPSLTNPLEARSLYEHMGGEGLKRLLRDEESENSTVVED